MDASKLLGEPNHSFQDIRRVRKTTSRERGGYFLEVALLFPVILLFMLALAEPLVVMHRYNHVYRALTELANNARESEALQANFWRDGQGDGYEGFKTARRELSERFAAAIGGLNGVESKAVTHLDRVGGNVSWETLSVGYLPPATSAYVDGWREQAKSATEGFNIDAGEYLARWNDVRLMVDDLRKPGILTTENSDWSALTNRPIPPDLEQGWLGACNRIYGVNFTNIAQFSREQIAECHYREIRGRGEGRNVGVLGSPVSLNNSHLTGVIETPSGRAPSASEVAEACRRFDAVAVAGKKNFASAIVLPNLAKDWGRCSIKSVDPGAISVYSSLPLISRLIPTELVAPLEVKGIVGTYKMVAGVPFFPNTNRRLGPSQIPTPQCRWTGSWSGWSTTCGPGERTANQIDGCQNERRLKETRCVGNCNWWRSWEGDWSGTCGNVSRPYTEKDLCGNSQNGTDGKCIGNCGWYRSWTGNCSVACGGGTRGYKEKDACGSETYEKAENCNMQACCYNISVELKDGQGDLGAFSGEYPFCLVEYHRDGDGKRADDRVADKLLGEEGIIGQVLFGQRKTVSTIDKDCKVLAVKDSDSSCLNGRFKWKLSPLSLIWSHGYKPESYLTIVEFPLDPHGTKGRLYEWRASGDAPLLVFDPDGKRQVTEASQLFGNHTFGKKWDHGYQPLASLDKDTDGKLSGKELGAIALWFDNNRDGISQPGEVRSANESGVLSVFVTPDNFDKETGWVHASKGYERMVEGKKETLPSVDWFAKPYAGIGEAIVSGAVIRGERAPERTQNGSAQERATKVSSIATGRNPPSEHTSAIIGSWLWAQKPNLPSTETKVGDGILVFGPNRNGSIAGVSFVELPVEKNADKVAKVRLSIPLQVTADGVSENGDLNYRAVAVDKKEKSETRSKIYLSADHRTLRGKTVQDSSAGSMEYEWTAIRIGNSGSAESATR